MSEHKVIGGTMYLFISPNNDGEYDTAVCLTSLGKDDSVGEVDSSSQCGPSITPGVLTINRPFEGVLLQDPDTGKISGTDLRLLMYSKQLIGYKIATQGLLTGDETETGQGYIFSLSSTYAFNEDGKFSGNIRTDGVPVITIES